MCSLVHALRAPGVRGQSLVEFALVLPILLILLLGILDFGRAVAAYNGVSNAARTGVRVAIVNQDETAIEDAVQAETIAFGDAVVTFDPNAEDVPDCPQASGPCCPQIGCVVGVTVSTEYLPATPIFSQLVGSITVSSESRMPIERVFSAP
jgi:Flp pilus assembly protein TadG